MRQSISKLNLPEKTIEIMMASKSNGTWRQYESGLKKWCNFCEEKNWSNQEANITHVLILLTKLFESGLSYSVINSCRSALSSWLGEVNGVFSRST